MSGISTHILDTSLGRPAAGVPVVLEQEADGSWQETSSHITDSDGRVKQLLALPGGLAAGDLKAGIYRLSFDTKVYFEKQKIQGLYPLVQIIFVVRDAAAHYHIPLLLTANGYSTYRGS